MPSTPTWRSFRATMISRIRPRRGPASRPSRAPGEIFCPTRARTLQTHESIKIDRNSSNALKGTGGGLRSPDLGTGGRGSTNSASSSRLPPKPRWTSPPSLPTARDTRTGHQSRRDGARTLIERGTDQNPRPSPRPKFHRSKVSRSLALSGGSATAESQSKVRLAENSHRSTTSRACSRTWSRSSPSCRG